jgi:ribosomal protein S18 acetylase RimI-like enzyme
MGAISQDLSAAGVAAAIDKSWIGACGYWGAAPSVELHDDEPDVRWYVTHGVPFPLFNHAYFTRLAQQEDIDARIGAVVKSFGEHGVPFMWSVGPFAQPNDLGAHLESRGLPHADELPGMAVDLQAINEDAPIPSGLATERVSDEEALRECVEVIRGGFEMPEFTSEAIVDALAHMGLTDESPFRSYLGKVDGEAVSASALFLESGLAGVYNVATLPEVRRRGLGAAVTLEALRDARELGYRIGVLQSSAMGFGVYRRLGFERYSTYHVYVGTGQE